MSYRRGGAGGGGAYSALGQGLRGIGRTVGATRRDREDREIAEKERERAHGFQDFQQGVAEFNLDSQLASMGGARSPIPTEEFTPNIGGFGQEPFDPDPLIEEPPDRRDPIGADAFMPPPDFDPGGPVSFDREKEGYQAVGPDGQWHIRDPDLLAGERDDARFQRSLDQDETTYGIQHGRRISERDEQEGRLHGAMSEIPHIDEATARALSMGVPHGVLQEPDQRLMTIQTEDGWATFNPDTGAITPTGHRPPPAAGPAGAQGPPAAFISAQVRQAEALLSTIETVNQYDILPHERQGMIDRALSASPFESVEQAQQFIMSGGQVGLPEPGYGAVVGGDDDDGLPQPLTPAVKESVVRELGRFPQGAWPDVLGRAGYGEDEIEEIIQWHRVGGELGMARGGRNR